MEFFTTNFTVIFLSVMGGLTILFGIIWIISGRKIGYWKKRTHSDNAAEETVKEDSDNSI